MTNSKIVDLDEMARVAKRQRAEGRCVVHCHGVFDLLHVGHIKHFDSAKKLGDLLVVTLTPDRFVNKGPGRPVFSEQLRAEAVAALQAVDYVAINRWPTAVETIKLIKPNVYAKGPDYTDRSLDVTGKINEEERAVQSVGGRLETTKDITFSSSNLINRHISGLPKEIRAYLEGYASRRGAKQIAQYMEKAESLKVLVVGETILDEYVYCEAIGKSSKEPTLVVRGLSSEKFAGGILALANHVASFSNHVTVLTQLGDLNRQEDFVRSHLNKNITQRFLYRKDAPTIVKRRFIEQYFFMKIMEVYEINDLELNDEDNKALCDTLEELVPQHDLVIVVDYGHGFLSREAIEILCKKSKFLAVNAQSNAGNLGYHTISMYPRADYITTTESEMRLEARNRRGDLKKIIQDASKKLQCDQLIVTRGKHGCLCYDAKSGFVEIPAVAEKIVDRVGAGDAFLSLSALCAVQNAPIEVVGLVGNVAGAHAVATVGNKEPVSKLGFLKHVETLLK